VELLLEAERFAARTGRRWVMDVVRGSGDLPGTSGELLELLAGELLANAVVHGPPAGRIWVAVEREDSHVRVAVRDQSTRAPLLKQASPTALGGRGVALVDALSTRWGVEHHGVGDDDAAGEVPATPAGDGPDRGPGKTVWFVLDVGRT
jgi:serine/threonine-protein kinase RsbW